MLMGARAGGCSWQGCGPLPNSTQVAQDRWEREEAGHAQGGDVCSLQPATGTVLRKTQVYIPR